MAGIRELRGRIKSVGNIKQITRAMEMVATTKLRRFQDRAMASRPYAEEITGLMGHLAAVLGSAAFQGLRDPANVVVGFDAVGAYTVLHVLLFLFVGLIAAAMANEAKKSPEVLWLLVEFFIVFEFGFYAAVVILFSPILAALATINIAVGNLLAAAGMGYYLWRAHPELREKLSPTDAGAAASS